MKRLTLTAAAILSIIMITACENSKPKKTPDNTSPEVTTLKQDGTTQQNTGRAIRPPSAELAPDFEVKDLMTGRTFKLSDYKGKVVILDFWATWCPPCKAEIPFFIELEQQYGKQGLAILGAATDDPRKVKAFYKNNGMNYPVFEADQQMAMNYGGIQGIPTTFIIDRDGYIREKYVGFRPKSMFEEAFLSLK